MPTIQDLFGSSSSSESGSDDDRDKDKKVEDEQEDKFDKDEFEREWAEAEREWDEKEQEEQERLQELLFGSSSSSSEGEDTDDTKELDQQEYEEQRKEQERKVQAEKRWQQVQTRYEKHPPRELNALKQEYNGLRDFFCFSEEYPQLVQVARKRIESLNDRDFPHDNFDDRTTELRNRLTKLRSRHIDRLPCSVMDYYYKDDPPHIVTATPSSSSYHGWTPILQTFLKGTRGSNKRMKINKDNNSGGSSEAASVLVSHQPLTMFRYHEDTLVRRIFSFLSHPYANHVTMTIPAEVIMNIGGIRRNRFGLGGRRRGTKNQLTSTTSPHGCGYVAFAKVGQVLNLFPPPKGRNVNMMPFELGNLESLPDDLQCYYPLIDSCPFFRDEFGKVAYLTVQESDRVEAHATQRRPGLHIESPGIFADNGTNNNNTTQTTTTTTNCTSFTPAVELHHWGRGSFGEPDRYDGGIYIVSNVDDSTAIYDALVDNTVAGIVDRHGGIQHLKQYLPPDSPLATKLQAGELVWMTDCTPHEALPQKTKAGPRTFFRLVMPNVTHWYAAHSTPNSKVQLPDSVVVIDDCKFAAVDRK